MSRRIVVVGNGMAGARVADELLRRDASLDIVVYGAEQQPAYNRVLLSDVLAGKRRHEDIVLADTPGAVRRLGVAVTGIDRGARVVEAADGSAATYDVLVLATGSAPVVPPVQGIAGPDGRLLDGVHVFRTVEDCAAIARGAKRARTAVVVGGGLLGLEAANALVQLGLETHVVEMAPRLMPVQLDEAAGATLVRHIEKLGVTVHTGVATEVITGTDRVDGLAFKDGERVDAQVVVFSAGIRPRDALAREAGRFLGVVVQHREDRAVPRFRDRLARVLRARLHRLGIVARGQLAQLRDAVAEAREELREDRARVAARAVERRVRRARQHAPGVVDRTGLQRAEHRAHGQREVGAGVAVRHREHVDLVEVLALGEHAADARVERARELATVEPRHQDRVRRQGAPLCGCAG